MVSIMEIMQLCRLCLVKEQVNVPIFDEQGDIRQICLKISACLPVKVSKEDKLPKKICDGCLYKLELLYQFYNTTANAEKQLLSWIEQAKMDSKNAAGELTTQPQATVKQEKLEPVESTNETPELSSEAQNYILQQQQLQYQSDFPFKESQGSNADGTASNTSANSDEPIAKRPRRRRQATKPIPPEAIESSDDNDAGDSMMEMTVTKTEEESESDGDDNADDPEPDKYVAVGDDADQPGPSGLGKGNTDTPCHRPLKLTLKKTSKDSKTVNWNKKLPEIDIIPVEKVKLEPNFKPNEDLDELEITRKSLPPIGYVNPFNYSNLKAKNLPRKSKQPEYTNRKWTCIICGDIAASKEALIDHYEIHRINKETKVMETFANDTEYFNCAICGQEFTSLKTYERHFDAKHGERNYTCFVCQKVYKDAFQLAIHNYTFHPEDYDYAYQCVLCDFKTAFRGNLKDHLLQHEASCKLKCEICGKGFENEANYEEHKSMHGSTASFSCDVCGDTFPYTQHLINHKKEVHPEIFGDNLNQNECHICNKKFAHKKSLILHIRGHTGEDSVLCDMCGKRLTSGEHLKQHLRIHTGFKPHKCSVCGKGFAKKCNLTLHERVHSGEKPYKCRVCSKSFSQRSTLVIHERYHSGERPYVCTLCNKGFVAKGLLSVHIKTCSAIPEDYLVA